MQIAHTNVALNKANAKCRQRQFHHAVDANHTVEVWKTTNSCNGCCQGKTSRIVAIGEMRFENQGLENKRDSVGAKRECLPKLGARLKTSATKRACAIAYFHSTTQTWSIDR